MPDAFISYSRRDTEYVRALAASLTEAGKDVWVDTEGIRDAERFPEALARAIEGSDSFLFVISPDSVESEYCEQEIQRAAALNKRIVPLSLRPVPDDEIPDEVRYRNWIPVSADEPGTERVIGAMEADLGWEQQHTRLTVKALEWEAATRDRSFLLRGADLQAAEVWLAAGANKDPGPTALEQEYLLAARQAASRRQRTVVGGSLVITAVAIGLLIFALISRSQAVGAKRTAISAKTSAQSQALAADSENEQTVDPELGVLLGIRAVKTEASPQAMFALRDAIDASPIRVRVNRSAGAQACGGPSIAYDPVPGSNQLVEGVCQDQIWLANSGTGRVERELKITNAQYGTVSSAYTPDGSEIVSNQADHPVLVNPRTGAVIRRGPLMPGLSYYSVDPYAPLVVGFGETPKRSELYIWNRRTGRFAIINGPPSGSLGQPYPPTFSPNGDVAIPTATSYGRDEFGLLVFSLTRRKLIYEESRTGYSAAAYSPDGHVLAVGLVLTGNGGGAVAELNARTFAPEPGFRELSLTDVQVSAVGFSPDGHELAYGFADGTAGVLNASTGSRVVGYLGDHAAVESVAFSPDGSNVATAGADGSVRIWRAQSLALANITSPGVLSAVQPDGDGFAALLNPGSRTSEGVAVQRYSAAGQPLGAPLVMSPTDDVQADFLGASGTLAAVIPATPTSAAPTHVQIWNIAERRRIANVPLRSPTGTEPVLSADGRWLASNVEPPGNTVNAYAELLNLRTGKERRLAHTHCPQGFYGLAFNATDTQVAVGDFCDGDVTVYAVATGKRIGGTLNLGGELAALAFRPDGRQLAVASWDSEVKVTPLPVRAHGTGATTLPENGKSVPYVSYSPNGQYLATASLDSTVRIFDSHTLTQRRIITQPGPVYGAVFTRSGADILAYSLASGYIGLWNACEDCENPAALTRLAQSGVTRQMTAGEKGEFGIK